MCLKTCDLLLNEKKAFYIKKKNAGYLSFIPNCFQKISFKGLSKLGLCDKETNPRY